MVSRLGSLAPDAGMPVDLMVPHDPDRAGLPHMRASLPPGPARERMVASFEKEMGRRAADLPAAIDHLREIVLAHDPVVLIESIAFPASAGVLGPDVDDDAPETTTWDAKIEYLQGLALSGPPGTKEVTGEVTEAAITALGAVYDAANADLFFRSIREARSDGEAVDGASFLLRLEALSDRMAGYAVHLDMIDTAVFDPHRDFYISRIGFCPSDLVRVVRRQVGATNELTQRAMSGLGDALSRGSLCADDDVAAEAVSDLHRALTTANRWAVDEVAGTVEIPRDELVAMLRAASVPFNCQPDFRSPFDRNEALARPLVRLDDENFFAPLPWSLAHNVHGLVRALAAEDGQLSAKYQRHRSNATETLITESLRKVFGTNSVSGGQHYVSSAGAGEIDCLVSGNRAWCIEGKSHALTEPARRGHRPRIERVTKDVVRAALDQTERAKTYILKDNRRDFASRQGGNTESLLPQDVSDCLETIVSLERMDPIKALGLELAESEGRITWLTGIADFLMVVDVLDDPATLLDFVTQRSLAAAAGVMITMESDALEGYLHDRLESIIETASANPDTTVMLGYGSSQLNRYHTMLEASLDVDKPTPQMPASVRDALRAVYDDSDVWTEVAVALATTTPAAWRKWKKFVRRKPGRTFVMPGTRVALTVDGDTSSSRLLTSDTLTLVIPATLALG